MLPTLRLAANDEIRTTEAVEKLSDEFKLTPEERVMMLPSGKQAVMTNRVSWAITYLVKAGLAERLRRGYFRITDEGRKILAKPPHRIDRNFLSQFERYNDFRGKVSKSSESTKQESEELRIGTPEEQIDAAYQEYDLALRTELLKQIHQLSPSAFEKLILELMLKMGYGTSGSSQHLGSTRDGGVDGVINQDALGLYKIYLQAKRYSNNNPVTVEKIREFAGVLDIQAATKGVFVTTSSFASEARKYALKNPKRIVLIDGEEITRLLVNHNVAVRSYRRLELKKVDTEFIDELEG